MDFLRIYSSADLEMLPIGTWGIREPGDTWGNGKRAKSRHSVYNNLRKICADSITSVLDVIDTKEEKLDIIILPGIPSGFCLKTF